MLEVQGGSMSKEHVWLLIGTILSWSLGFVGADRIYKGQVGLGILKLVTFGGFGLWWLIDALIWTAQLGEQK